MTESTAAASGTARRLAAAEAVYADNLAALHQAEDNGLPNRIPVYSSSPHLVRTLGSRAIAVDRDMTPARIADINRLCTDAARRLYTSALKAGPPPSANNANNALAAAVWATQASRLVLKTAAFSDHAFPANSVVITLATGRPDLDQRFNGDALATLVEGRGMTEHRVSISVSGWVKPAAPPPLLRLRRSGAVGNVIFRMLHTVAGALDRIGIGRTVWIGNDDDLVRETCLSLALSGIMPQPLPQVTAHPPAASGEHGAFVATMVDQFLETVGGAVAADLLPPMRRILAVQLQALLHGRDQARGVLDSTYRQRTGRRRPKAVLTSSLPSPTALALKAWSEDSGVPVCYFQHGVTAEYNDQVASYQAFCEGNFASLAFTYNERRAALETRSPFSTAAIQAIGASRAMRGLAMQRPPAGAGAIWYISTAASSGHFSMWHQGVSDVAVAAQELRIIDDILARLPARVFYKPYPTRRYLDPDPWIERAGSLPNITLYDAGHDMRYLMKTIGVLVTSGATGTLTTCLLADRPLVFLVGGGLMPLTEDARRMLAAAVFCFDLDQPDGAEQARALLARPVSALETQWAQKATARQAFMETYVDSGAAPPGSGAAARIRALMADKRP